MSDADSVRDEVGELGMTGADLSGEATPVSRMSSKDSCGDGPRGRLNSKDLVNAWKAKGDELREGYAGKAVPEIVEAPAAKGYGKGPAPKGKGTGSQNAPLAPVGKGGLSYKEKQAFELAIQEDRLSAEEGFAGKPLTEWEAKVLLEGATDQEEGPYAGKKFQPTRGYFACKRCGTAIYLAEAKFVH